MSNVLVLAEKPEVAGDIAQAMLSEKSEKNGYFTGKNGSDDWVVTSAFGHLMDLADPKEYDSRYGRWSLKDLPLYFKDWKTVPASEPYKTARLKLIGGFIKNADTVICAGDPDDEGQLLIDEILDHFDYKGKTLRVFINDNLEENIKREFTELKDNDDYRPLSRAASARRMADYCFGVNESRLAGIRLKKRGLAVGRVQTPTLGLVVARDEQIENHIKEKYYELSADVSMQGYDKVDFAFHPDKKYMSDNELSYITDREWLDGIGSSFDGKDVDITVTEKPKTTAPPLPYNLTALQSEMNRRFGYTAAKTLNITQSLRTKKAITYNRSDSRYLKEEHYRQAPSLFAKILGGSLTDRYDLDFSIHSACFNDKNVTAHHGIIPQEVNISLKSLTKDEKNVYLAICDRYAQQFMKPLKQMVSTAQFPVPDGKYAHKFEHTSYKTLDAGYTAYFGRDKDEEDSEKGIYIPKGNYEGNVTGHSIIEKETRPPARYTEGTLIKDMSSISKYVTDPEIKAILKRKDEGKKGENGSIGTVATRSTIIDALVKRGFLAREGKNLVSTQLGRDFYHVLPPEISKADTTAKWWLIQEAIIDGEETDPNAIQQSVLEEFNRHKDTAYEGMSLNQEKEKVTGIWNGNEISFNRVWGEYTFSDEEAEKLLAGEKITINVKGRQVTGSLAEQTYRKHKFVGFKADITPKSEQEGYVTGTWNGKEVAFKREWGGHTFTDEEIEHLLAGEEITIRSKSKKGRDYEATGKLAWQSFRGIKFFGFKADFGKKKKE